MEQVIEQLQSWIRSNMIPGASLRVLHQGDLRCTLDSGVTNLADPQPIDARTLFDLASLTKVVATLPAILRLMQAGELRLTDTLERFFPDCPPEKQLITIEQLLLHTSGLPADLPDKRRNGHLQLPEGIFQQEMLNPPGSKVVYSDLGMILLGLILEKVTDQSLAHFVKESIHTPLGMHHTCYRPDHEQLSVGIAATEYCHLQGGYLQGVVHDEKAHRMGGVAGHAGLFATADDLIRYVRCWLYGEGELISSQWRECATRCHTDGAGGHRGLGWERNHGGEPTSCGSLFSQASYGHTGFTGTSIWIDPKQDVAVIWLTNAVHLGRDHKLRTFRPLLHDEVMKALGFGSIR
ncbi:MAG TPA: serine hydrolase domain-containing protein [Candidatus Bathyarchaeia archaeon]|nr:serine hydrolase domain-containing protein [Candidatus Bathyarchaeia archaeon]